jgi:predicted secreted protein
MSWATGLMVYVVIWWTVLFAVLPLGVRRAENPGAGQDRGAPERPNLLRKAIITSVVAAVLWLGFYFFRQADIFSFRSLVEGT